MTNASEAPPLPTSSGKTYHNIIVFGAGASFDAGIPLLASFVDKMWEYAIRGRVGDKRLSEDDLDILTAATTIRMGLERYNSRAAFDNRNLEDILSLLSFEALGDQKQMERYTTMVRAVARTIELSCRIQHVKETPEVPFALGTPYHKLWHTLLDGPLANNLPAIITFNYDLVLERTLWESFHRSGRGSPKPTVNSCGLKYSFGDNDFSIKRVSHTYSVPNSPLLREIGEKAQYILNEKTEADIPYFKLHGSLNWSQDSPLIKPRTTPTQAVENPLILPPVFNKMNAPVVNSVWKGALDLLRKVKHIIVVGYSLPKTDIYMQYFLKSAVGPNSDLQRIIVFDPVLFKDDKETEEMKRRYEECFSPQFSNRIDFKPCPSYPDGRSKRGGTFAHFIHALEASREEIMFFP